MNWNFGSRAVREGLGGCRNGGQDPSGRRQSAQAMVELALSVPILLLVFVIGADFGRAYFFDLTLRDAAFAAARYGAMNPNDDAGIKAAAVSASNGALTAGSVVVSGAPPRASGQPLTVTTTYAFSPITPLAASLTGPSIIITRSATDIIK